MPRIIVRKPRIGDIHPLSESIITNYLRGAPPAYVYGLKAIELRPRKSGIGDPYGLYSFVEKRIWLYSCPEREWRFPEVNQSHLKLLCSFGAQRVQLDSSCKDEVVVWDERIDLEIFTVAILFHELGHHYVNQYKSSRRQPATRKAHEGAADLHMFKLTNHFFFQFRE